MKTLAFLLLVALTMQVVVSTSAVGKLSLPSYSLGIGLSSVLNAAVDAEPNAEPWHRGWSGRRRWYPYRPGAGERGWNTPSTRKWYLAHPPQRWTDFSVAWLRIVGRRLWSTRVLFSYCCFLLLNLLIQSGSRRFAFLHFPKFKDFNGVRRCTDSGIPGFTFCMWSSICVSAFHDFWFGNVCAFMALLFCSFLFSSWMELLTRIEKRAKHCFLLLWVLQLGSCCILRLPIIDFCFGVWLQKMLRNTHSWQWTT